MKELYPTMPFVSPWIAAENDRRYRVRILGKILLEAVKTDSLVNWIGWGLDYIQVKLKKLAAKHQRSATPPPPPPSHRPQGVSVGKQKAACVRRSGGVLAASLASPYF